MFILLKLLHNSVWNQSPAQKFLKYYINYGDNIFQDTWLINT
jgi:hypothetical protein